MSFDPVIIGSCGANLASLSFALGRLGIEAPVTEDPARVRAASHVLLPGVGAARDAMSRLTQAGLADVIPALTQPVLGICLGMQVLFASSEEEDAECVGVLPGRARRLPGSPELPVPHMGWNSLTVTRRCALLAGIEDGDYAYFVHSYALPELDCTCATADYGGPFSAVVARDNFFGAQFHPERSSKVGARLLENFFRIQ
jgi:imidazole glycerol-phosphate synthase subunit HisH